MVPTLNLLRPLGQRAAEQLPREVSAAALAVAVALLIAGGAQSTAYAQTAAPPAAQQPAKSAKSPKSTKSTTPKAEATEAEQKASAQTALEQGMAALNGDKVDLAVARLSDALTIGKLPPRSMALALYYRGVAYRRQAKPAQAIADLTSALWLKGGLAPADRTAAEGQRAAAYAEAGIAPPDSVAPVVAKVAAPAARTTATVANTTPAVTPTPGAWQTATASSSAAPSVGLAPGGNEAAATATADPIGGFFKNLFAGAGNSSTPVPAATPAAPAAQPGPALAPTQPATSAWSSATTPARGGIKTNAITTASTGAAAVAAAPAAPSGRFMLQVSAHRSKAEAEATANRVRSGYAGELGGRGVEVGEVVMGNMGTLYRVVVAGFASEREPQALCKKLQADQLDCLVTKR